MNMYKVFRLFSLLSFICFCSHVLQCSYNKSQEDSVSLCNQNNKVERIRLLQEVQAVKRILKAIQKKLETVDSEQSTSKLSDKKD